MCKRGRADFPANSAALTALSREARPRTTASEANSSRHDGLERPAPQEVAQTGTPDQLADPLDEAAAAAGRPTGRADEGVRPALELLEDRLGRGEIVDVERHLVQRPPAQPVADAELDARRARP